jgi:hypothetical protein
VKVFRSGIALVAILVRLLNEILVSTAELIRISVSVIRTEDGQSRDLWFQFAFVLRDGIIQHPTCVSATFSPFLRVLNCGFSLTPHPRSQLVSYLFEIVRQLCDCDCLQSRPRTAEDLLCTHIVCSICGALNGLHDAAGLR